MKMTIEGLTHTLKKTETDAEADRKKRMQRFLKLMKMTNTESVKPLIREKIYADV